MTDLAPFTQALATQEELTFAEQVFQQLRQALPKVSRDRDPLVIAAVGDLQVRLAAARALQRASAADDGPVRQIQARLAADSAHQLAAELQREWLAGVPSPRPLGAAPRDLKRLLGEHHLKITD